MLSSLAAGNDCERVRPLGEQSDRGLERFLDGVWSGPAPPLVGVTFAVCLCPALNRSVARQAVVTCCCRDVLLGGVLPYFEASGDAGSVRRVRSHTTTTVPGETMQAGTCSAASTNLVERSNRLGLVGVGSEPEGKRKGLRVVVLFAAYSVRTPSVTRIHRAGAPR